MSTETGYQGWKNYETWCVKLWMDNDHGEYEYWREATREAWREAEDGGNQFVHDRMGRARILLAAQLKDVWDDIANERYPVLDKLVGPYADLLNAALGEVDWYEIAQSLLDDEDLAADDEAAS